MLSLSNFESYINPTILFRGKEYYDEDLVTNLNETSAGEWEATVRGTEYYTVEISVENDLVTNCYCDCPYDGTVCKHVVATLYAIRDESKKISTSAFIYIKEVTTTQVSDTDKQLTTLLQQTSPGEIIKFVLGYAETDAQFKAKLVDKFVPKPNTDHLTVDFYKEIETCFLPSRSRNSDRRRYYNDFDSDFDYQETASRLKAVLQKAQTLMASNALGDAASIAIQVLKSIADNYDETTYNYYEDDGVLSYTCSIAEDIITKVIEHPEMTLGLKKEILETISPLSGADAFCEGIYDLGDMIYNLNINARTPGELLEYLNEQLKGCTSPYKSARYADEKINLLTKMNRLEEALEVTRQYIGIPEIREKEILRLIGLKDYAQALQMADEGITISNGQSSGYLIKKWKYLKLNIYQITNDTNKLIATAREIFILEEGSMEMYHLLKKHIACTLWVSFLEKMMQETKFGFRSDVEFDIYVEEGNYETLLTAVLHASKLQNLNIANRYLPHLKDRYPEELLQLYETWIVEYAEQNIGRKHYEYIAAELKNMREIKGGTKAVQAIVDTFRAVYKNRRAMMEVLGQLKST